MVHGSHRQQKEEVTFRRYVHRELRDGISPPTHSQETESLLFEQEWELIKRIPFVPYNGKFMSTEIVSATIST